MKKIDVFKDYENTRVVHYTELDSYLGESVPWDKLPETEVAGTPVSIRRKADGKLPLPIGQRAAKHGGLSPLHAVSTRHMPCVVSAQRDLSFAFSPPSCSPGVHTLGSHPWRQEDGYQSRPHP